MIADETPPTCNCLYDKKNLIDECKMCNIEYPYYNI